jgi:hypothetical protein
VAYVPSEKAIVVVRTLSFYRSTLEELCYTDLASWSNLLQSHQGTRFSSITSVSEAFSFLPSRLSKIVFPS